MQQAKAPRRYYLLRSADDRTLGLAVRKSEWPVSLALLDRLNDAFASTDEVVLIFTVTMSGRFQGCARMAGPATDESRNLPACKIEWLYRGDVPYSEAEHLINPLSDPPQPVRAGKDGTEIDPKAAEELLGLLQKAAANPRTEPPAAATAAASGDTSSVQPSQAVAAAPAALPTGMPGMVGSGLMGAGLSMPDSTFMMGINPMLHPLAMMHPLAAAIMMNGMQGMMAAGMRPGGLPGMAGLAASGAAAGAAAPGDAAPAEGTAKAPPRPQGPPPGFEGGSAAEGRHGPRDDWARDRDQRFGPHFDGGPRGGGPPFRDGPFRDGPPFGFRGGPPPFRDGPASDRHFYDHGPPAWPGFGPPAHMRGPPPRQVAQKHTLSCLEYCLLDIPHHAPRRIVQFLLCREYDGPGSVAPQQARQREHDERGDVLQMSYEEYVQRFWRLKEVQGGGPAGGGGAKPAAGAEGKENAEGGGAGAGAATVAGEAALAASGGAGGAPTLP
ncbi:hypothetical protein ABPG75_000865 [Micractinium tetrahymenae]